MPDKSQPNIYDIAKQAGVSIATVSRVLSGGVKVRESTRKRVEDVMAAAGYRPSALARGLGTGSMRMAGVMCAGLPGAAFGTAVPALESLLREKGLDTLLCRSESGLNGMEAMIERLLEKHVDAIILVGPDFAAAGSAGCIEKAAASVPVIMVNGPPERPGAYCVSCDEKKAMRENVSALYDENHRKILYLRNGSECGGARKLDGYREGLDSHGLEQDESLIIQCGGEPDETKRLLIGLAGGGLYFDSVLASDDALAVGACKALSRIGRRLPVIGFGNSILAACSSPEITSVDNRLEGMCAKAVEMLADLLAGMADVPRNVVMDAKLVRRDTF